MSTYDYQNNSAADIEREVETTRARVSSTLGEIRGQMAPSRLVDRAVDYARESGATDTARHVGQTVRDNPIPFVLIGAGLGWFVAGRLNERFRHSDAATRLSAKSAETRARADGKIAAARARANGKLAQAQDGAYHTAERLQGASDRWSAKAAQMRETVALKSSEASNYAQVRWNYMLHEQPLMLAGVAFAVGATVGALVPVSRFENRVAGPRADALKQQARDMTSARIGEAKEVASNAINSAKDELNRHGYSADGARQTAEDTAQRMKEAAEQTRAAQESHPG